MSLFFLPGVGSAKDTATVMSEDSGMLTQIYLFSLIKNDVTVKWLYYFILFFFFSIGEESKTNGRPSTVQYVTRPDDETFTSFFDSLSVEKCREESIDVDESDFDVITPYSEL